MAPHDIYVVQQMFDAYARGDDEAFLAFCHPDAEVVPQGGATGRTYQGREELRRWLAGLRRSGTEVESTAHRLVDMGDHILVTGRLRTREADGGVTDSPAAWRIELCDGQFRRVAPA